MFWSPGCIGTFKDEMDYFDNDILWKADYTYEWLVREIIPKAIYDSLPLHKKALYGSYRNEKIREEYMKIR